MKEINDKQLLEVMGGINWSAALITAGTKAVNTILDMGRSFGSAIRRLVNGSYCKI